MRSTQPGVSFKLGYYDSSRNEIVASYDRQSYGFSDDGAYRDTRTHNLAIISYRRWISDSRNFRPFL
ncbi:hypothetical protein, partial [Clostridioides difficile]|uniref:hypothetical protein n=1 Tax=Clostridioides difficile TaxID=1496 RepID=UPI001A9AC6C4